MAKKKVVAAKKKPVTKLKKVTAKKVAPKKAVAKKVTPKKGVAKKSVTPKMTVKKTLSSKKVKAVVVKKKVKKVMPIPKGYHAVTPYLIVDQGKAALEYYQNAFGAKVQFAMEIEAGKITHAEFSIGDSKVMLGEACEEMGAHDPKHYKGSPVGIHLYVKDVDAVVEKAVKAGGSLTQEVRTQFYGDRSGEVKDPFGHFWHIATHVEDVKPAELKKRAAEFYAPKAE